MQNPSTLGDSFDAGGELPPSAAMDLEAVPSGAFALAGTAVALLLIAWLAIYFLVFLTRGPVG